MTKNYKIIHIIIKKTKQKIGDSLSNLIELITVFWSNGIWGSVWETCLNTVCFAVQKSH